MARISFNNVVSKYPNGKLPSSNNNSFDLLNCISIIIGIGALVSSFFIPFVYSLLICILGIIIGIFSINNKVSGIVINFFSFFLILIIVFSIFIFSSAYKFVKHNVLNKEIGYSINNNIY